MTETLESLNLGLLFRLRINPIGFLQKKTVV